MRTATPPASRPCSSPALGSRTGRGAPWQFSLRALLGAMLCVALLSGLWQNSPQLALFAAAAGTAAASSWRLSLAVRRQRRKRLIAAGFLCSWGVLYVASVGPALAVTQARPAWDPIFETVYAPLERLCGNETVYAGARWYLAYWRLPID